MNVHADLPFLIRSTCANGFLRFNDSFSEHVCFSAKELSKKPFLEWIVLEDQFKFNELIEGKVSDCKIHHITKDGAGILLKVRISEKNEKDFIVLAQVEKEEIVTKDYNETHEQGNVKSTLHEIAHIVEEQNPGFKCSILLVEDGHFVKGAGPSLPDEYNNAIDGFAIGPTVGSCGTAIFWNVPVVVTDIQNDPLWTPFAELAKQAGVNACWSHPFTSKSGSVLGALAFYSAVPKIPTKEELNQLKGASRMTGLAVERGRAEEALRIKHQQALELEEQLRQAAKMEALGVLAGGVAHDFNNILAAILSNAQFTQLLIDKIPESKEKERVESKLKSIVKAGQRAGGFCKQLLSYAGHESIQIKNIEVGKLLSEIDSLVTAAISKRTTLKFDLCKDSIFINGDENQLLQVIMNLITNAGDVLKEDGGEILVSTKLVNLTSDELKKLSPENNYPPGKYVDLSVKDNGSGMSDQVKSKIFDPFYTTKSTGRGLGLSAVKGIVKMHNGVIYLKSELSKGTTFTVLLPVIDLEENTQDSQAHNKSQIKSGNNKQLLYVEDDDDILEIMTETLEFFDYQVVKASNGQEAVDIFRQSPNAFYCVILDLHMPILGGKKAAEVIFEINNKTPIIILSGNPDQISRDDFDESILVGSLMKPVEIEELIDLIENSKNKK
jgi:signal transduction histidine kinase